MKIIVSHDVDHLSVFEHYKDLIVPKFILRSILEVFSGSIGPGELLRRSFEVVSNRWNNVEDLAKFDSENEIPSTFFFGMANGLGLSYSIAQASNAIRVVQRNNLDVGVHGIAYSSIASMRAEHAAFANISGRHEFGLRMHYLRCDEATLRYAEELGYTFDSTTTDMRSPYRIGKMWEFPLHMMDGAIMYNNRPWVRDGLEVIMERTLERISEARRQGVTHFTLLFHQIYFSDAFSNWKEWYIRTLRLLKEEGHEFISFKEAAYELSKAPVI